MKNTDNILTFDRVSAIYRNNVGIFDISFELREGEFVFIMGPTGSGKSTILRSIYMDINVSKGNILFKNQNLSKIKKKNISSVRRQIGMIFQDYKLLEDRTVFDNVALPLQISGHNNKLIEDKVNLIINDVGLSEKLDLFPGRLSGGERQRVSIARALVKEPSLVLADEPTGNLDPIVANEIINLLEELANTRHTAVLMSTNNFPLVQPRKKRFIEMDKGKQVLNEF